MLNKWKIRTKLLVGFSLVALIAGIIGAFSMVNIEKMNKADTALYENVAVPLAYCTEISTDFQRLRITVYDAYISSNSNDLENYFKKGDDIYKTLLENLNKYQNTVLDETDKKNSENVEQALNKYYSFFPELRQFLSNGDLANALSLVRGKIYSANTELQNSVNTLLKHNVESGKNMSDSNTNLAQTVFSSMIIFVTIGIILAIILGLVIASNIQRIIKSVIDQTKKLVNSALEGKLTDRANVEETNEEFREIVMGINETLDALLTPLNVAAVYVERISKGDMPELITENYKGDFNKIKNNLNNLITAFNEIITKSKLVSLGDLSVSLVKRSDKDELMEALDNMVKSMREIADKALTISKGDLTVSLVKRSDNDELMGALSEMVNRLSEIVGQVMEASQNVATSSNEMSTSAVQISEGASEQSASAEEISSSIEQMTSSIQQNSDNSIATEKIAVASAQGMHDVNTAAQKSLEAMRQISEKIKVINDIAGKTDILAINAAIEAARAGEQGKGFAVVAAEVRKLAEVSQKAAVEINELSASSLKVTEDAGNLMMKIIPEIQNTAQLVKEIAAASNEQRSGSEQITQAVIQFTQVTQQNAAAAEEMSSSSEELASQAELLRETISYFNLGQKLNKNQSAKLTHKSISAKNKSDLINKNHSKVNNTAIVNMDSLENDEKFFETY